ncbi:MAG: hypothetical protein LBJ61_12440 [Deltaproteobacteria bacterium]|nr:hypothetical protein [Deltaproteobacteria bacterium]
MTIVQLKSFIRLALGLKAKPAKVPKGFSPGTEEFAQNGRLAAGVAPGAKPGSEAIVSDGPTDPRDFVGNERLAGDDKLAASPTGHCGLTGTCGLRTCGLAGPDGYTETHSQTITCGRTGQQTSSNEWRVYRPAKGLEAPYRFGVPERDWDSGAFLRGDYGGPGRKGANASTEIPVAGPDGERVRESRIGAGRLATEGNGGQANRSLRGLAAWILGLWAGAKATGAWAVGLGGLGQNVASNLSGIAKAVQMFGFAAGLTLVVMGLLELYNTGRSHDASLKSGVTKCVVGAALLAVDAIISTFSTTIFGGNESGVGLGGLGL